VWTVSSRHRSGPWSSPSSPLVRAAGGRRGGHLVTSEDRPVLPPRPESQVRCRRPRPFGSRSGSAGSVAARHHGVSCRLVGGHRQGRRGRDVMALPCWGPDVCSARARERERTRPPRASRSAELRRSTRPAPGHAGGPRFLRRGVGRSPSLSSSSRDGGREERLPSASDLGRGRTSRRRGYQPRGLSARAYTARVWLTSFINI
jgi:hypothetical protein